MNNLAGIDMQRPTIMIDTEDRNDIFLLLDLLDNQSCRVARVIHFGRFNRDMASGDSPFEIQLAL